MSNHQGRNAAFICALALLCAPAAAQDGPSRHEVARFATYENDRDYGTDRYYTSGVQLSVKRAADTRSEFGKAMTSRLCRLLGCEDAHFLSTQTNFGQLIYTPSDITVAAPQPLDRPWGGLLYLEQVHSLLSRDERTLTTLTAQAGVTGRASLAEPAQKLIHRILDRPRPQGWDNQIGGSLGLMVTAEQRTAREGLSADLGRGVQLRTATYWRIALGTIQTYAAAGVAVVAGKNLPLVSPPPPGIGDKIVGRALPMATSCLRRWVQCTAFGSVEARAVGYNVFLDGRPWRDDPQVRRRKLVADLVLGTRLDFPDTRGASHGPWFAQVKMTRRSPEFRAPFPVPRHTVAAFTVGTEF